jgi:hypothetical protein
MGSMHRVSTPPRSLNRIVTFFSFALICRFRVIPLMSPHVHLFPVQGELLGMDLGKVQEGVGKPQQLLDTLLVLVDALHVPFGERAFRVRASILRSRITVSGTRISWDATFRNRVFMVRSSFVW